MGIGLLGGPLTVTALDLQGYLDLLPAQRRVVDDWLRAHDLLDKKVVGYEVVGDVIHVERYQQNGAGGIVLTDKREFSFEQVEVPLREPPPEIGAAPHA
jgi:hypothetical protein